MVRKIIMIIWSLLPLTLLSCGRDVPTTYITKISSVHDGDTFSDTNNIYRLYGVDTPEVNDQYNGFMPTEGLEAQFGISAKRFVDNMIFYKNVTVQRRAIDKYNRVVASVTVQGKDLALTLIKNGLARVAYIDVIKDSIYYTNDYDYYQRLLYAQHEAYTLNKGIWAFKNRLKEIFPKAVHI